MMKECYDIKLQGLHCTFIINMIALNTVPSLFTVSQATREKSIGLKKKRFP